MDELMLKKLGDVPRVSQTHVWADYIELLALIDQDGFYSSASLEDSLIETDDIAIDQEGLEELDSDNEGNEADAAIARRWADIRACFTSRAVRLGDDWPFKIEDTVLSRRIDLASASNKHKLYIGLLIASCLRYVEKDFYSPITSSLEFIGHYFFKKIMPDPWIVKPFAAHQKIADGYTGTLFNKFEKLAKDINAKLMLAPDSLDPRDTGDGGIDLVAWLPFDDKLGNIPVAFAQCGCSLTDLSHKEYEASPANLSSKIVPQHPGLNYYFAPHDLRRNNGMWNKLHGQVILLDRCRIMKLANQFSVEDEVVDWPHISQIMNMRLNVNG